jgi:hypothetical protein
MKHTTYSVDIAKNVVEIAVSYEPGVVRESHRVARAKFLEFFAKERRGSWSWRLAALPTSGLGSWRSWAVGRFFCLRVPFGLMFDATRLTARMPRGSSRPFETKKFDRCR